MPWHSESAVFSAVDSLSQTYKQSAVYFTVVSTYIDGFLQYLEQCIEILCNTKIIGLPTSPT